VKYDPGGNARWATSVREGMSTSYFHGVAVDADGSIYAAGSQYGTGEYVYDTGIGISGASPYHNVILVKYNSSGNAQWARSVSTGFNETMFNAVAVDQAGSVYAAGFQTGSGSYTYGPDATASGASGLLNAVLVKY
jgi:hypothetical protein